MGDFVLRSLRVVREAGLSKRKPSKGSRITVKRVEFFFFFFSK